MNSQTTVFSTPSTTGSSASGSRQTDQPDQENMRPSLQHLQQRFASLHQKREPLPCFLDFEASSLSHRSYPIEVAYSLENGWVESHLIRPPEFLDWQDWSAEAEALHGISRDLLSCGGRPPVQVVATLNRALRGRVVYCDGGDYDRFWLSRLYQAAGMKPSFRLADCAELFEGHLAPGVLERLARRARGAMYQRHRAALDVGYLQSLWQLVRAETRRLGATRTLPMLSA